MKERVMGMVLSAATIGEYDKRIVLLTKERGRISAFARGARRPKSPLSAATEPFTFGEFYIYKGKDSYVIEQVEAKNYFPELRKDLDDLYMGLYFCEVASYFTREGMQAKEELNLLYLSLRALLPPSKENWYGTYMNCGCLLLRERRRGFLHVSAVKERRGCITFMWGKQELCASSVTTGNPALRLRRRRFTRFSILYPHQCRNCIRLPWGRRY